MPCKVLKNTLASQLFGYCLLFEKQSTFQIHIPENKYDSIYVSVFAFLHEMGHIKCRKENRKEKYWNLGVRICNILVELDATIYAFNCMKKENWNEVFADATYALLTHIENMGKKSDYTHRFVDILNTRMMRILNIGETND